VPTWRLSGEFSTNSSALSPFRRSLSSPQSPATLQRVGLCSPFFAIGESPRKGIGRSALTKSKSDSSCRRSSTWLCDGSWEFARQSVSEFGVFYSLLEAAAAGLVDEVVPAEQVVTGAITWCREMLSLPRGSMSITRQQARSDLAALFERDLKDELEMVIANWCDQETQSVLRLVVERLAKKKT